jgi:hypothetical protein
MAPPPEPEGNSSTDLADRLDDRRAADLAWTPVIRCQPAMKLRIRTKSTSTALGIMPARIIVVSLVSSDLQAEVGTQSQSGQDMATVIFRVFVDDKKSLTAASWRDGRATHQDLVAERKN